MQGPVQRRRQNNTKHLQTHSTPPPHTYQTLFRGIYKRIGHVWLVCVLRLAVGALANLPTILRRETSCEPKCLYDCIVSNFLPEGGEHCGGKAERKQKEPEEPHGNPKEPKGSKGNQREQQRTERKQKEAKGSKRDSKAIWGKQREPAPPKHPRQYGRELEGKSETSGKPIHQTTPVRQTTG